MKPYIKPVGMYNQKAKNLIELCRRLVELHGGEVPNDREALESLPGVGRKTANVILNIVFGHTTIAVDTHIFRVSNRTGIAPGKRPARRRRSVEQSHARRVQAERASLAAAPRAVRVHRASAGMPEVHHPRSVRVRAQDTRKGAAKIRCAGSAKRRARERRRRKGRRGEQKPPRHPVLAEAATQVAEARTQANGRARKRQQGGRPGCTDRLTAGKASRDSRCTRQSAAKPRGKGKQPRASACAEHFRARREQVYRTWLFLLFFSFFWTVPGAASPHVSRGVAQVRREAAARAAEAQLAAVIVEHPEYVQWLEAGDAALAAEFTAGAGRSRILFFTWGCTWPFASRWRRIGHEESRRSIASWPRSLGTRTPPSTRCWSRWGRRCGRPSARIVCRMSRRISSGLKMLL